MKKKHKKNHKESGPVEKMSVRQEQSTEKESEGDLLSAVAAIEKVIASSNLTAEDANLLRARLESVNAKLVAEKQAAEIAMHVKAYETIRKAAEVKIGAYEALANANLLSQKSIDAARAARAEINLNGLLDEDVLVLRMQMEDVDEKIEAAQNSLDKAATYALKKAEMEKKIAAIEQLAGSFLPIKEKKEDIEESAIETRKSDSPIKTSSKINKSNYFIFIFLLLIVASYGFSYKKSVAAKNDLALKDKTEKFIRDNLVQPGTDLKITEFVKEGNLYKFTVTVGSQKVVSYVTGDGKKLLLNPVDLDGKVSDPAANSQAGAAPAKAVAEASNKKDVPEVELFVMSLCPYGIQAEKGILPVIQKLGSKINFSLKFVDYTLHGKKEFDENLNQYCLQKEEPAKFDDYLACYVKSGDAAACATSTKIDSAKNSACIAATDKEFKLTDNFVASGSSPFGVYKDLNDKYGVQGSPSLVINGQLVDAGRDSAGLMKTICSGFTNQPEECKADLSAASPAPGFGN